MATIFALTRPPTESLAASFRHVTQVARAVAAGADSASISLELLETPGDHLLSDRAIAEFAEYL